MWLNVKPVLHIVDTRTGFENAIFIRAKSAESLWIYFINFWATIYIRFPQIIRLDRETRFTSVEFSENAKTIGIELQLCGNVSHSSMGQVERYQQPLKRIFNVNETQNNLNKKSKLRIFIKAMNETMGPNRLVLSQFVLGT